MLFFEHARKDAEAAYAKDPLDAENLTRLGGALLELSQFQVGDGSLKMVEDAVSKLEEALRIGPKRPETLWCLGNAQTSRGLNTMDQETALIFFSKASECFEQAMNEDPGNDMYRKSYELSFKVPEMHSEVQRQLQSQQASAAGPSASKVKASKKKKDSDLIYDVFGWVILAVSVVVWVGMAKSNVPPPPPR